jgi:pimeloyl-ACP methyl ester carboxylesterase
MDTPQWFTSALAAPSDELVTEVDGCSIAYRCWGQAGAAGLILVHGGAAHARWWDHIAPMLGRQYRVAALDLSGHGDSGRRDAYSLEQWSAEVVTIADAAGMAAKPVVIGHSMGGFVALATAGLYPERISGVAVIDSPVRERTPEELAAATRAAFGPLRVYPSREEALSRFHTVPVQDGSLPFVMEHVAQTSLRKVQGGWTWKFDRKIFDFGGRPPGPELLRLVAGRVAIFRSECGLLTPQIGDQMYELLGRVAPVIEIPLAGHHAMLDQPLSLITGLRTLLADWQHSAPRRRQD